MKEVEEINKLQENLQTIRKVAGWTTEELGQKIGVTKQTISNLENKNTKMTKTQYIAIRAILDYEIDLNENNIALARVIEVLLGEDDERGDENSNVAIPTFLLKGNEKNKSKKKVDGITLGSLKTVASVSAASATATKKWLEKILNV
ncbi:MAG: helix-turn-helix transcriptional regulator [Lachnospiraceae bacterium]|nr:helix-turn-helix transcriptional regulator [Lachnospiraceae bacterium]